MMVVKSKKWSPDSEPGNEPSVSSHVIVAYADQEQPTPTRTHISPQPRRKVQSGTVMSMISQCIDTVLHTYKYKYPLKHPDPGRLAIYAFFLLHCRPSRRRVSSHL